MSQSPPLRVCARGCNEATTHFQNLLAGLQRSHNAFSSPPPLCSRGCNEATTHFQALHRSVCAVRGPCCRHQEEGVQHPNDQQQRLSLSAARWKETEGAASSTSLGRHRHRHCPAGPRGLCLGPHRPTSPLSLGLHRPGPHWHLQAHIPSRSASVHCGGPQRITSLLVQTSTSQLNLVIKL